MRDVAGTRTRRSNSLDEDDAAERGAERLPGYRLCQRRTTLQNAAQNVDLGLGGTACQKNQPFARGLRNPCSGKYCLGRSRSR